MVAPTSPIQKALKFRSMAVLPSSCFLPGSFIAFHPLLWDILKMMRPFLVPDQLSRLGLVVSFETQFRPRANV
ncbi:hypothetical protein OIU74_019156 [Salix koriyanagi]|uniref:Uncharacterized protein n=1 Tax=Salix koriyanagi TaxID=2511006 RepID=A0A9Q0WTW0_9ROSI|nr:hypothetical protein OIU74_019156 [Salix koriyanagi]